MNKICEVAEALHSKQCTLNWCSWDKESDEHDLTNKEQWDGLGIPHHKYYYTRATKLLNIDENIDFIKIINVIFSGAYEKQ